MSPINPLTLAEEAEHQLALRILEQCSAEYGLTPKAVRGPTATRYLNAARYDAIWRVHGALPHWTPFQLGRLFRRAPQRINAILDQRALQKRSRSHAS